MKIHKTAIVDSKAEIADDVTIGPYSVIMNDVIVGSGVEIGSHVTIDPYVTVEADCKIFSHTALGGIPQSFGFKGGKTYLKIKRGTIIREYVTMHRGTEEGGGVTEVGEENYLMAYAHVAHDCITGKGVIFANCATLGGHITIGDYANIGGLCAIHQFVRVGEYAYIGGKSAVVKDIPPYVMAVGDRATLRGLNTVGLQRHGFSSSTRLALKRAYRIIFRIGLTLNEAVERVKAEVDQIPEVVNFIKFVKSSQRGITR